MLGYRTFSPFTGSRAAKGVRVNSSLPIYDEKEGGAAMYRFSNAVRSTHNQDGAIVLDVRQGQMFNVNFVGSRILERLKNGSPESVIIDEIGREFGVSHDLAENDVREFLHTLKKSHLVEEFEPNIVA
jgi:hypothetical protein